MNNYLKLNGYEIALYLIIFFIGGNLIGTILGGLALLLNINTYVVIPIATLLSYGLVYFSYSNFKKRSKKEIFKINYSLKNFKYFPLILIIFIGQFFISEFISSLIPTEGKIFGKLYQSMSYGLLGNFEKYPWITFFSICILAPLLEEIFFRGFLLKGMLNNQVKPYKAIIISALLFGGIHFYPWQIVGGFFAGIVLGLSFYKTGSLLICTLLHFLNNFLGFLLFMKYHQLEMPTLGLNEYLTFFIGILIVIFFGYIYLKQTKNYEWRSF